LLVSRQHRQVRLAEAVTQSLQQSERVAEVARAYNSASSPLPI
jgi:hypothetical protein